MFSQNSFIVTEEESERREVWVYNRIFQGATAQDSERGLDGLGWRPQRVFSLPVKCEYTGRVRSMDGQSSWLLWHLHCLRWIQISGQTRAACGGTHTTKNSK